jgi:hypothetical protein
MFLVLIFLLKVIILNYFYLKKVPHWAVTQLNFSDIKLRDVLFHLKDEG